jgi:hypothetical protein
MRRPIILTAILAVTLTWATTAAASVTDQIVHDCLHSPTGGLTGTYPRAALKQALHNLPGDAAEYSSCHDAIYQALLDSAANPPGGGGGGTNGGNGTAGGGGGGLGGGTGAGGSGTTGSGSGGTVPVAVPRNTGSRARVTLDGSAVQPGAIPAIGRDAHRLPTPLLVFLVLLGIGALAPAATTIGRRVIARRRA